MAALPASSTNQVTLQKASTLPSPPPLGIWPQLNPRRQQQLAQHLADLIRRQLQTLPHREEDSHEQP